MAYLLSLAVAGNGSLSAQHFQSETCRIGIPHPTGSVCCPVTCGQCGGRGCSKRAGGAKQCCKPALLRQGRRCQSRDDVACVIAGGTSSSSGQTLLNSAIGYGSSVLHRIMAIASRADASSRASQRAQTALCSAGIRHATGGFCCNATCGTCGGRGCSKRPGGPSQCCEPSIRKRGRKCLSSEDVACALISSETPPAPASAFCRAGIAHSTRSVCCPTTCGKCGGPGCSKRGVGAKQCCVSALLRKAAVCQSPDDVGCVLNPYWAPSQATVSPLLRRFTPGLDGEPDPKASQQYDVINGERLCGWECDSPKPEGVAGRCPTHCHGTPEGHAAMDKKHAESQLVSDACAGAPLPAALLDAPPRRQGGPWDAKPACDDPAAIRAAVGLRLLIGVMTGPTHTARRDAIRTTWMLWATDRADTLVCFILGRRGLSASQQAFLDVEAAQHRDVFWLGNITDEGVPTLKGHAWWSAAASLLPGSGYGSGDDGRCWQDQACSLAQPGIRHVAKVDDDAFLHLPNLLGDLRALRCKPHLYYGSIAYTGYDPIDWWMCGWAWQAQDQAFRKRNCSKMGAHPPFPFVNGALELLSASLVEFVGTSPDVTAFVARAAARIEDRKAAGFAVGKYNPGCIQTWTAAKCGPHVWQQNEDVVLGFWLTQARPRIKVTYVRINNRATNMGCFGVNGLYARPRQDAVVVHWLKHASGQAYVWGLLHDGVPHNPHNCSAHVFNGKRRGALAALRRIGPPMNRVGPPPQNVCRVGIKHVTGTVCCNAECGACGGRGCSKLPGGAKQCCKPAIHRTRRQCITSEDVACSIV